MKYKTLMESYEYIRSCGEEIFPYILEAIEFRLSNVEKINKKIKKLEKRIEYLESKEESREYIKIRKPPVSDEGGQYP